jgi:hypothetical protein
VKSCKKKLHIKKPSCKEIEIEIEIDELEHVWEMDRDRQTTTLHF